MVSSTFGGVGFGTFIDELGKFITKDNNYFFEPTVSIIYVIFILIYLSIKAIEHFKAPSQKELLVNALEIEKESLVDPTIDKLNKAQIYLSALEVSQPHLANIQMLLNQLKSVARDQNTIITKIKEVFSRVYEFLDKKQFLNWIIIGFFLLQAGFFLYHSAITTDIFAEYLTLLNPQESKDFIGSFDELGNVIFTALSGLLILVGVFRLFKSRLAGFQLFKLAILVNLFLTSIFDFYTNQFEALFGFFFNLLILMILNLLISIEKAKQNNV